MKYILSPTIQKILIKTVYIEHSNNKGKNKVTKKNPHNIGSQQR